MTSEKIRYDLQSAHEAGQRIHPEAVMTRLAAEQGFEIVSAEPLPIGGCWIFLISYEARPALLPFIGRDA